MIQKQQKAIKQLINYYESELKIAKGHKNQLPQGYIELVKVKLKLLKKDLKDLNGE